MAAVLRLVVLLFLAFALPLAGCGSGGGGEPTSNGGASGVSGQGGTGGVAQAGTGGAAGQEGGTSGTAGVPTAGAAGHGGSAPTTGAVTGVVMLRGQIDHSGATVMLNGTDQVTVTDETGTYWFEEVEPGTYTVTASLAGYGEQTTSPVEVVAGQSTFLPPLILEEESDNTP